MNFFLDIIQIIIGILLIGSILLQVNQGGIGVAFGGSDSIASTRRGAEKGIFIISVILSTLFILIAAARIFIG